MTDKLLSISVSATELAELQRLTDARHMTLSELVRGLIKAFFEVEKTKRERVGKR